MGPKRMTTKRLKPSSSTSEGGTRKSIRITNSKASETTMDSEVSNQNSPASNNTKVISDDRGVAEEKGDQVAKVISEPAIPAPKPLPTAPVMVEKDMAPQKEKEKEKEKGKEKEKEKEKEKSSSSEEVREVENPMKPILLKKKYRDVL